jgi:acetylornithine deacetylase/succinyl-diaminopimelate desuccinylase-like protein
MKQFMDEARKLIRINSVATGGNEEIANYANGILQDRGFKCDLQPVMHSLENISKRQFNVIGVLGDPLVDRKTKKGLLLLSHLDTAVPGASADWTESQQNPFELSVANGQFTGLGVASGKLDFLCRVHAAQRFRERKLKMPIYIVGTCGGTLGMFGAKYLIQARTLNPLLGLVSEPTGLQLATAQKSCTEMRLSIGFQKIERDARGFNRKLRMISRGRPASSADPSQGEHAILHALALLEEARASGFELRFTALDGGVWPKLVPDLCQIDLFTTSHQFEDFKAFFHHYAENAGRKDSFELEAAGMNESGVNFLPEALFPCLIEVFSGMSDAQLRSQSEQSSSLIPGMSPPGISFHFSMIKQRLGGIDLFFDFRADPWQDASQIEAELQKAVRQVSASYSGLNMTLTRERSVNALFPKEFAQGPQGLIETVQRAARSSDFDLETVPIASASEAALFQKAGYEVAAFGPGSPFSCVGSPNENVSAEELERAMVFYDRLIQEVCL